jgi:hypothetical protein
MGTKTLMRQGHVVLALIVLASSAVLGADRPTDRDVKALVDRLDQGRDHFVGALDDKLKHDVLRGPAGEVDVERYLNDFDENIDRLKDRLKPEYAASNEAAVVLRQASAIDAFFRKQAPGTRGESEWNRLAIDLKALAAAYGADFPLTEKSVVRRVGDRELAGIADQLSREADRLKRSLDTDLKKDTAIDAKTRQSIVSEADELARDAKTLRDRLKDGEPSSAEADRLLSRATKVQSIVDGHQAPTAVSSWASMTPRVRDVADAYRVAWSGAPR